jgi:hypothetical protein
MYQLTNSAVIIRLADGASIPMAPGNRDYADYLAWAAAGNVPTPAAVFDWREPIMADFRLRRDTYLDRLAGIAVFDGEDDAVIRDAAGVFRQRLLDLPADPTVTGATSVAALQSAVVTLYRAAATEAATAAPAAKTAFDRIAK